MAKKKAAAPKKKPKIGRRPVPEGYALVLIELPIELRDLAKSTAILQHMTFKDFTAKALQMLVDRYQAGKRKE